MSKVPNMPSEVSILKSKAAAKTGPGAFSLADTETVWPKAEFVRLSQDGERNSSDADNLLLGSGNDHR